MADVDLKKLQAIFLELKDLPAKERESWLDHHSIDLEMRTEVLAVFRNHDESKLPIDQSPLQAFKDDAGSGETVTAFSQTQSRSQVIGPYKLLQKIGEGGMGQVWMAEQQHPVRRRVAVKFIKGGMDSDEVIARFEAERQALAMMDHQHIAKVLDAGQTEDNRPYFVMELVQGIPFNKYCDENKLSLDDRLRLFVPVCKAVQHAHQKGIIHRDLKPSNVLVTLYDGKPVPKVIDFGMAKALQHQTRLTDRTLFTEFGKVMGTLEYMSPEQAEMNALDVDTRTDIYSLGIMLYELLTGSTPLQKETLKQHAVMELLQMVKQFEPPLPSNRLSDTGSSLVEISSQRRVECSKLLQTLKGDLDWVVMKALEKDRSRRYPTADAFAEDIENYLNNEAVEARPPSAVYRFSKILRRHFVAMLTACVILVVLLIGIVGTTWQAIRATAAENRAKMQATVANSARQEAEKQRSLATLNADEAQRLVDFVLNLVKLPGWRSDLPSDPADLLEEWFQTASSDVQDLNVSVQSRFRIMTSITEALYNLRKYEAAEALALETIALVESIDTLANNELYHAEILLYDCMFSNGRQDKAISSLLDLESRIEINAKNNTDLMLTSRVGVSLAYSYLMIGDTEKCLQYAERLRSKIVDLPGDSLIRSKAAFVIGYVYCMDNDFTTGVPYFEESLRISSDIYGEDSALSLQRLSANVAWALTGAGRHEEAINAQIRAIELYKQKFPREPKQWLYPMSYLVYRNVKGGYWDAAQVAAAEYLHVLELVSPRRIPREFWTLWFLYHELLRTGQTNAANTLHGRLKSCRTCISAGLKSVLSSEVDAIKRMAGPAIEGKTWDPSIKKRLTEILDIQCKQMGEDSIEAEKTRTLIESRLPSLDQQP